MTENISASLLLQKHFDTALETPDGIKKLRALILTLAMQGKLVPQDPADQPASELLKEIEAEKKQMVKDGKIRKQEPLPAIKDDEIPYAVPVGWEWVNLQKLAIFINGDRGKNYPSKDAYVANGIPFINAGHLNNGQVELSDMNFISEETFNILGSGKVQEYDILYCLRGSLGKTAIVRNIENGAIASSLVIIRPFLKQIVNYLYNYFISSLGQKMILNYDNGSAQPNLSGNNIQKYLIPLPPLAEQHRIVAKIDHLMALCDRLEEQRNEWSQKRLAVHASAINRLLSAPDGEAFATSWDFITAHFNELYSVRQNVADLKKAILQLAVMGKLVPQDPADQPASELLKEIAEEKKRLVKEGKIRKQEPLPAIKDSEIPYEVPVGWEWVRLNEVTDVGTGSTPTTTNHEYYNGTIPWYTSSATNNIFAEFPEKLITEKAVTETNCKIFPAGSLIIALYGQGKTRGQISELITPGATNQAIAAMVFYDSSKPIKVYLKYYFLKIYSEIRLLAEGAAQPNLNVGKIKNTIIPLPPLAEQKRIVAKIDQLMALCDELDKQIIEATEKKSAILNAVLASI